MIQNEYVTFKTAKLLKECGFPQGCEGKRCYENGQELHKDIPSCGDLVRVPKQALAMRWLREGKNLHINIRADKINYDDGKGIAVEYVCGVCHELKYGMRQVCNGKTFFDQTYEKALEWCIQKACEYLKRIEP